MIKPLSSEIVEPDVVHQVDMALSKLGHSHQQSHRARDVQELVRAGHALGQVTVLLVQRRKCLRGQTKTKFATSSPSSRSRWGAPCRGLLAACTTRRASPRPAGRRGVRAAAARWHRQAHLFRGGQKQVHSDIIRVYNVRRVHVHVTRRQGRRLRLQHGRVKPCSKQHSLTEPWPRRLPGEEGGEVTHLLHLVCLLVKNLPPPSVRPVTCPARVLLS